MKTTVELTREAGGFDATPEFLERLVALVRADEREACAKEVHTSTDYLHEEGDMILKELIAAAIRARGNT